MDFIELSKVRTVTNMEMFLRNFSKVPEDKLLYTPTPTAKSPLRVAAHTALYAGRFAEMIRNRALPQPDNIDEWMAAREAEEIAVNSREEAERIFRAGTQEVLDALDTLSPEEIESQLSGGPDGGSVSMRWLMGLPAWHATLHMGQIDYLQTCWDDQHIYVE